MRILVLSDCHGDVFSAMDAIDAQPSAKVILFLGDGLGDMDEIMPHYPHKTFYTVRGNCDFGRTEPATRLIEVDGVRIMMTHGHEYRVKAGPYEAVETARRNQCPVLVFGHTHRPVVNYEDGVHYLNPGSVSRRGGGTYGYIDITPGGVFCSTITLT